VKSSEEKLVEDLELECGSKLFKLLVEERGQSDGGLLRMTELDQPMLGFQIVL
jgi:hypothetical protein